MSIRSSILVTVALITLAELLPSTLLATVTKPPFAPPSTSRKLQPIRIRKFECPGQPYSLTRMLTCRVRTLRNQPQQVDFIVEFLEPQSDIFASFELYVQHQVGRTLLYGTTLNYCRTVDGSEGNKVTQILFALARKNMPHVLRPCPYGGILNASGISLGTDMIPAFTLPGRYRSDARCYNKKNQTLFAWISDFDLNQ